MPQNKISKYLLTFMIGLTGLLVLRDIMAFSYSKYLLVAYFLIFAVFAKSKVLAPMLCFMFPLSWGLPGSYIFLAGIFLYWIKRRQIPVKVFILISCYLLLEIFASFWYPEQNYIDIVRYISVLSIFFTFLYDSQTDKEQCIKAYYIGSLVLCSVILISTIKNAPDNWLTLFSKGWFRFGMQHVEDAGNMMLSLNANSLAYYSLIGFTLAVDFITNSKGKNVLFHIVSCFLFLITGIFSVSMSFIVTVSVCILLLIMSRIKRVTTLFYSLIITSVIACVFAYFIFKMPDILTAFSTRLNSVDLATANSRSTIFIMYSETFLNNLRFILFGTGVTQYIGVTNMINAMHNMIQQIFVCYGVFFGILFFTSILYPLKEITKIRRINIIKTLPLISVILFTQTIQFVNPESLMLPYVIAFYVFATAPLKKDREDLL